MATSVDQPNSEILLKIGKNLIQNVETKQVDYNNKKMCIIIIM